MSSVVQRATAILYVSRMLGERGLQDNEYKNTKIKAAVKLYCNADLTMAAVGSFEELAVQNEHHSIIKDDKKYAEELDVQLWLNFTNPVTVAMVEKLKRRRKSRQSTKPAGRRYIQRT